MREKHPKSLKRSRNEFALVTNIRSFGLRKVINYLTIVKTFCLVGQVIMNPAYKPHEFHKSLQFTITVHYDKAIRWSA